MNKILRNVFWLLFENGIRILLAFILNAMLARSLNLEQYGIIQYTLSLIVVFSSISFICGAEVLVPKLVNAKGDEIKDIISNVFWLRLIFSFIAYSCLLLFAYIWEDKKIFSVVSIMALSMLVGESFSVINAWLQSQTNSRPRSIITIIASLLKCSMVGILFLLNIKDVELYGLAWVLEAYLIAFALYAFFWKKTGYTFGIFSLPRVYLYFKKGLPFFLGLLLMYLFLRLDVIFLKYYSTLESVAIYSAANHLITAISIIAPILSMSIAPSLIYKLGIGNVKQKTVYIALGMGGIAIVLSLIFRYFSEIIVQVIYGEKFLESIFVFNYLIWVMVLYFINEGLNIYIIKIAKGKLIIIKWLLVLFSSSIAYIYFIPTYSYLGAIIGYTIGNLVAILYSSYILFMHTTKEELR